jgi:hypothetical protein
LVFLVVRILAYFEVSEDAARVKGFAEVTGYHPSAYGLPKASRLIYADVFICYAPEQHGLVHVVEIACCLPKQFIRLF